MRIGLQMRIRMRLHAELGHEQHQRQHVNEQAMTFSEQSLDLRPREYLLRRRVRQPAQVSSVVYVTCVECLPDRGQSGEEEFD